VVLAAWVLVVLQVRQDQAAVADKLVATFYVFAGVAHTTVAVDVHHSLH
jgi:hypothetical protein